MDGLIQTKIGVNGVLLDSHALQELCVMETYNDAGQHFLEWSEHYPALEKAGLIEIYRPRREDGFCVGETCDKWQVWLTPLGVELAAKLPQYREPAEHPPMVGEHLGRIW